MSGFKPIQPKETGAGKFIEETDKQIYNYPKTKKRKWEDDYTRATFYVENETLDELNRMAGTEKGEKTRIINEALQLYFRNQ